MPTKGCQYCGRKIYGVNEIQCNWNHREHERFCMFNKKSKKGKDFTPADKLLQAKSKEEQNERRKI